MPLDEVFDTRPLFVRFSRNYYLNTVVNDVVSDIVGR